MKKQNVNNKLVFGKATVTELNHKQMQDVNGGTSGAFPLSIITTIFLDLKKIADGGSVVQ